jgi:aspartyl-tRNA(Asn)/glutamyl-tRNA(Gln) amidotransferase subunit B
MSSHMLRLEPIIGLEIHIQLKTKTKMFCGCPTHDSAVGPNQNICPICLGHPGVLPVTNSQAVRAGILVGLALIIFIPIFQNPIKFPNSIYLLPNMVF